MPADAGGDVGVGADVLVKGDVLGGDGLGLGVDGDDADVLGLGAGGGQHGAVDHAGVVGDGQDVGKGGVAVAVDEEVDAVNSASRSVERLGSLSGSMPRWPRQTM